MRIRRVATAALMVFFVSAEAPARTLDQVPPYLEKEGKFVSYPALAMGGLGAVVGGIVALPAIVVAAPIGWAAGDALGYSLVPVSVVATGAAEIGYHVGGAIPWVLKNSFYDAPMLAVARIKGEPASGLVAQVEPPPLHGGDIQYLDTTPPAARVPVVIAQQYSSALPPPKPPTSLMLRRQLSPFKAPPLPVRGAPAKKTPPPVPPVAVAPRSITPAPVPPPAASFPEPVSSSVPPAPVWAPPSSPAVVPEPVVALPPAVVAPPEVVVPAAELPPPVVIAPPAVEAPPIADRSPEVASVIVTDPVPTTDEVPVAADVPVVQDEPAGDIDAAAEGARPALKKKRKFSERFSF